VLRERRVSNQKSSAKGGQSISRLWSPVKAGLTPLVEIYWK
jgi:hypothetical protein